MALAHEFPGVRALETTRSAALRLHSSRRSRAAMCERLQGLTRVFDALAAPQTHRQTPARGPARRATRRPPAVRTAHWLWLFLLVVGLGLQLAH